MKRLAALVVCFLSATASACADNSIVEGPVILGGGGLNSAAQMCVPGTLEIAGGGFSVDRCAMVSEPTTYVEDGVTRLRWELRGGIMNTGVAVCSCVAKN